MSNAARLDTTADNARPRTPVGAWCALLAGAAGIATLLFAPGGHAFLGLYGVIVMTVATVARTMRRRRPDARWAWWFFIAALCMVGTGTYSAGALSNAMAVQPNWFLVPGLLWAGSYLSLLVWETGIVTRQWGGRPDRAIVVDGLVVTIAVMVPTITLACSVYAITPGPTLVRFTTASYIAFDGLLVAMLAQLLLNGERRNPALWLIVAAAGIPVIGDFAALLLRASVDIRYLAMGWVASYVLIQLTMHHRGLPRLTEPSATQRVRLDGTRSVILAAALFAVPLTVVFGSGSAGPLATASYLAAAGAVAVLVLLRLTWLFRDSERAHRAVKARERHFRALVRNIGDIIVVADADGYVRYHTPSAGRLFGVDDSSVGASVYDLFHVEDPAAAQALFAEALDKPRTVVTGEVHSRHRDGSSVWLDLTVHDLTDDPDVGNVVITGRDVTERKRLEDELRREARHDALTDLPNRVLAFERLDRLLRRAKGSGSYVGVMFVDLDNFKAVNDSLGHGAGDELLCDVAARLVAAVRPQDTVARLGGDEFVVLAEMTDPSGFEVLARRVVGALAQPVVIADREVLVTASVGLDVGGPGDAGEDLLRKADAALYRAKDAGRNGYAVYSPEVDGEPEHRIDLAADLRRALTAGDQLRVYFQPFVELASGRATAVEALVRWEHPDRGLLLPESFISLAEENGLIMPLGKWVLEEACRQVASAGIDDLELAVNISARQLEDDQLYDVIVAALADSGLPAERLTLELTETVVMRFGDMTDRLTKLKELGVRIAVDDFGTGYSSLAYLRELPIDIVKVDRQFMAAIPTDEHAAALAAGVIELARSLGLHTVAEGVEEEGQAGMLQHCGCELAQGFYFARPAPLDELTKHWGRDGAPTTPPDKRDGNRVSAPRPHEVLMSSGR